MKRNNITRLNYQMIFDEGDPQQDEQQTEKKLSEVKKLLEEKENAWQDKLDKVRDEAYQKGLANGTKEGYMKASAEIDKKIGDLEKAFKEAHKQWIKNQEEITPNLISIAFDLTEAIIGMKPGKSGPVEEKLTSELNKLLQKIDQKTKSTLFISEDDKALVNSLLKEYEDELTVNVRVTNTCEQGEFVLENKEMKAARNFKQLLSDFKESLSIPHWS